MTPLEFVRERMREAKQGGRPGRFVVLWGWNRIADIRGLYELHVKFTRPIAKGATVWAILNPSSPDLTAVEVLEDRGQNLWCRRLEVDAEILLDIGDCRPTPIPLRPLVIDRRDLHKFIGQLAAEQWEEMRRAKLE